MERLKAFVVEELKLSASIVKPLTVRQLITALSEFNASSTLCWDILKLNLTTSSAATTTLDAAMKVNGALQQVFARCAEPVWRLVETELEKGGGGRAVVPPAQPAKRGDDGGTDVDIGVWLATLKLGPELESVKKALADVGAGTLELLRDGVQDGLITAASLQSQGVKLLPANKVVKAAAQVSALGRD